MEGADWEAGGGLIAIGVRGLVLDLGEPISREGGGRW